MITPRIRFAIATLLVAFLAVPSFTQIAQRKKTSKGPRAVAVLEWTPLGLRLLPVSLMTDGQFYDASLYHANPVPFALDEGNVYEVQHAGEVIGDFTVNQAAQIAGSAWVGEGKWVSTAERRKREEARQKTSTAPSKRQEEKDEPPVLRRGGTKPEEPSTTAAPAKTTEPAAPKSEAPAASQESTSDSDRPILRRGKPAEEQASKLGNEKPMAEKGVSKTPAKMPAGLNKFQVAVSDASTDESRPYQWKWSSPDEEQKMRAQVEKLALDAVNDYAVKTGGPKPGKLEDIQIHAFDLDYNNSPDVILSARVLPAPETTSRKPGVKSTRTAPPTPTAPSDFEYYVTVVGREDIYATLQKISQTVTDNKHLDAYPRMELIDAVDADGNGAGDLMFRRVSDLSSSFVIYSAYSSKLEELIRVPEPKL